MGMHGRAGVDS